MTALSKDFDEVGRMPFCRVSELVKFWRMNPPPHVTLRILAEGKQLRIREEGDASFLMDPQMARMASTNTKPLSSLPGNVAQMFKDIKSGKIPGLKRPDNV